MVKNAACNLSVWRFIVAPMIAGNLAILAVDAAAEKYAPEAFAARKHLMDFVRLVALVGASTTTWLLINRPPGACRT